MVGGDYQAPSSEGVFFCVRNLDLLRVGAEFTAGGPVHAAKVSNYA